MKKNFNKVFFLLAFLMAATAFFGCVRTEKKVMDDDGKPVRSVSLKGIKKVRLNGNNNYQISGNHFITEEAQDVHLPDSRQLAGSSIPEANGITMNKIINEEDVTDIGLVTCSVTGNATVLGIIGDIPQFVVRDIDNDTKTVWIGGNWQDYGSTKEGLEEGLRRGVFELQPHRAWSHMNWDLDSPPGPWWGSPVDGEMKITDWYNEVVDVRRGHAPVPSNDLLFIYRKGIEAIQKSFGVIPLAAEVRPGAELLKGTAGGYDNGRIAAIAGLGVSRECYVGTDRTIEFKMMMPEQFTFHDLDLTAQTEDPGDLMEADWDKLRTLTTEQLMNSKIAGGRRLNVHDNTDWIESRKDKYWMGFNETCAYLHSEIAETEDEGFGINFTYDDHYCRYFETKTSLWTIEFSDHFREALGSGISFQVDGRPVSNSLKASQKITLPAGLGFHSIEVVSN